MKAIRTGMRTVVGLVAMVAVLGPAAWAQNFAGPLADRFNVSWGPRTYGLRPSIEGYVANHSLYWVSNVRLRIEGLDAAARPVGERYVWTFGTIAPSDRGYFVAETVRGATTYRITVVSFDVVSRGGGP